MLYNGTWGTVCDDFWTDDDASVICRMLNFRKGGTAFSSAHFGEGSGQIWLDNVNCTLGYTVTDISNCHHLSWGTNNCGHNEDAGVTCTFVDIRLVNRTDHSDQVTGRVEVYHGNSWGTVCDDGWTSDNSRVVCRQLGYRDQLNYYGNAVYGQGKGPILMDDVSCLQPFPERIWNCSFNGWGSNNCGHSEDIAVSCAKNEIRLVNGHGSYTGRLEILQNGTWGTVCDDNFSDEEARVICRTFGLKYGKALPRAYFGSGTGTIYVDNLDCTPSYTRPIHALMLGDTLCSFNGWGINDCSHSEDVGVWCSSEEIRLAGGRKSGQGRVEINRAGTWGTICNNNWDDKAVNIVCGTLGYSAGISFHPPPGLGRISLDNVRCSSSNSQISSCSHSTPSNCDHYKDAGVWCIRNDNDVVLAKGSDHFGRVEIYHGGSFRTLCYGYLDTHNADVLCRLVGHRYGGRIFTNPYYVESTSSYLRYLRCAGNEYNILSCNSTRGYYTCPRGNDLWIDCNTACDYGNFGQSCLQRCHCKVPGCDISSGRCKSGGCLPGWQGSSCSQKCGNRTFGPSCSTRCHCASSGCDPVTGVCLVEGCMEGWTGYSCDRECTSGTFGLGCARICHCNIPGCDHVTGLCFNQSNGCKDGWKGPSCDTECPFGTFGRLCSYECHCNNMGCDKVTGHCLNQQDACAEGWTGVSCDKECDLGFFGVSCLNVCHCLVPGCNPVSGVCNTSECERGWSGYACNISVQGEMEKDVSNGIIHEYGIISAICVGLLLVISVAVNVWMCVKRKRTRMSDNADNEPCYENVQHRQLSSPTTSQTCDATATPPGYEELQFRNATRKAYENVTYENSYDSVELRAGGNSTARL